MNLYQTLQNARSEEDVKDIYIKALGLKSYTKGFIDIRTDEIWFEAKDTGKHSSYAMFTQLLHYVQVALNEGENLPPLLAVIDTEKAALMKTADVLPFLKKKTIKWGKSAKYTPEALAVLDAGRELWRINFTQTDERTTRDELKLNRADVGWYQIRKALQARNKNGDNVPIDFNKFEQAYSTLSDKLRPLVYEYGFLRE